MITKAELENLITLDERMALFNEGSDAEDLKNRLDSLFEDIDGNYFFSAGYLNKKVKFPAHDREAEKILDDSLKSWMRNRENTDKAEYFDKVLGSERLFGILKDHYVMPQLRTSLVMISDKVVSEIRGHIYESLADFYMKDRVVMNANELLEKVYPEVKDSSHYGSLIKPRLEEMASKAINDETFRTLCIKSNSMIEQGARKYIREKTQQELDEHRNALIGQMALGYGWLAVSYLGSFFKGNAVKAYDSAPRDEMMRLTNKLKEYMPLEAVKRVFDKAGVAANRVEFAKVIEENEREIMNDFSRAFTDLYMQRFRGEYNLNRRSEENYTENRFAYKKLEEPSAAVLKAEAVMDRLKEKLFGMMDVLKETLVKEIGETIPYLKGISKNNLLYYGGLLDKYYEHGTMENTDNAIKALPESYRIYALENEIRHQESVFLQSHMNDGKLIGKNEAGEHLLKWVDDHPEILKMKTNIVSVLKKNLELCTEDINRCIKYDDAKLAENAFINNFGIPGPALYLDGENRNNLMWQCKSMLDDLKENLMEKYGAPERGCDESELGNRLSAVNVVLMKNFEKIPVPDENVKERLVKGLEKIENEIRTYRADPCLYITDEILKAHSPEQAAELMTKRIVTDFSKGGVYEGKYSEEEISGKIVQGVIEHWKIRSLVRNHEGPYRDYAEKILVEGVRSSLAKNNFKVQTTDNRAETNQINEYEKQSVPAKKKNSDGYAGGRR